MAAPVPKVFLIDITTFSILPFQYVPREIKDERSANYAATNVPGDSNPRLHYVNGDQIITVPLQYTAIDPGRLSVQLAVRWLQQRTHPDFGSTPRLKGGPHVVKLVWGSLFIEEQWVITNVKTSWKQFNALGGILPQSNRADVELTMRRYTEEYVDQSSVNLINI